MACDTDSAQHTPTPRPSTPAGVRVLLAYFSRAGENYYYGGRKNLEVGNTELLARLISGSIACDVHRIEAAEPYSDDYDHTVARNVREQSSDARPVIANPLPAITGYDVVLLGSGLWNVRPPLIMRTFAEGLDFSGRTVLPVTTYAMSGLGRAAEDYAQACRGATIGNGLAVRGEEVGQSLDAVLSWLRQSGLR
ncbi:flavodoxin [Amycolatopsis saalfeldensis]|uniref:Flavodoxin n=1 Tax=Amycolatopsis saalfeldensis TaxID=394193 RepID=A0A1H8YAH6_9PSEU|nr:flavodoxin [Amycolatopsis saalfeldensis]SEP48488.1 Flavodoxin [Amycolatopsis saalfeldensis]